MKTVDGKARTVREQCHERKPGLLACIRQEGLPFEWLPQFGKADQEARQLYRLADRVWDPLQLARDAQVAA